MKRAAKEWEERKSGGEKEWEERKSGGEKARVE